MPNCCNTFKNSKHIESDVGSFSTVLTELLHTILTVFKINEFKFNMKPSTLDALQALIFLSLSLSSLTVSPLMKRYATYRQDVVDYFEKSPSSKSTLTI